MRETLRKLAIALPGVALLGGVAFAGNGNLGDWGGRDRDRDRTSFEYDNETDIDIDNDADIWNDIFARVNSGENEVEDNDGDVDLATGDASASVDIENAANRTDICVEQSFPDFGDIDWEDMRGEDNNSNRDNDWRRNHGSGGQASFEWDNNTEIDVDNDADIHNDVRLSVNTGDNEVEDNDGDVSVSTGDASANVSVSNMVNYSSVTVK